MKKNKIVFLSGAGISAESGIKTFRDNHGLWENHKVEDVASPEGWVRNKQLVLNFYNQRRAQLKEVSPNRAHKLITEFQKDFNVVVITQNVDNLHERAGNNHVIHLHGELNKVRSVKNPNLILDWYDDLNIGDLGSDGEQLRPHIVWFGEQVPMLNTAAKHIQSADIVVIIGTSMQVYPAASLIDFSKPSASIYYIDPNPKLNHELKNLQQLEVIKKTATEGMDEFKQIIKLKSSFFYGR